jgi:hypothetical protein
MIAWDGSGVGSAHRGTPLGWLPTFLRKSMAPPSGPLIEGARIPKQDANAYIALGAGRSIARPIWSMEL